METNSTMGVVRLRSGLVVLRMGRARLSRASEGAVGCLAQRAGPRGALVMAMVRDGRSARCERSGACTGCREGGVQFWVRVSAFGSADFCGKGVGWDSSGDSGGAE